MLWKHQSDFIQLIIFELFNKKRNITQNYNFHCFILPRSTCALYRSEKCSNVFWTTSKARLLLIRKFSIKGLLQKLRAIHYEWFLGGFSVGQRVINGDFNVIVINYTSTLFSSMFHVMDTGRYNKKPSNQCLGSVMLGARE